MPKMRYFLEKSYKNRRNVKGFIPLAFNGWGIQTPCLLLFYTVTTFCKRTILSLQRFVVHRKRQLIVETQQKRLFFTTASAIFLREDAKAVIASGRRYPSYVTVRSNLFQSIIVFALM